MRKSNHSEIIVIVCGMFVHCDRLSLNDAIDASRAIDNNSGKATTFTAKAASERK